MISSRFSTVHLPRFTFEPSRIPPHRGSTMPSTSRRGKRRMMRTNERLMFVLGSVIATGWFLPRAESWGVVSWATSSTSSANHLSGEFVADSPVASSRSRFEETPKNKIIQLKPKIWGLLIFASAAQKSSDARRSRVDGLFRHGAVA